MGEGVDFQDLLVAGLDCRRRLEALFFRDDINGLDETISLVRVDAEVEGDLLALRECGRRCLGEIGLIPERRVNGRADEDAAGKASQERAGKPAQRNFPGIQGSMAGAIGFYGRIHAKFDAGTEPGRLNTNDRSLRPQRHAHRHRVASILRTAALNFTRLTPSDWIMEWASGRRSLGRTCKLPGGNARHWPMEPWSMSRKS